MEELKKLGGSITEITVEAKRVLSDGDFGSVGKGYFITISLNPKSNIDQIVEWADKYTETQAQTSAQLWLADVEKALPDKKTPEAQEAAAGAATAPSSQELEGLDTATMTVKTIKVSAHPDTGEHIMRVQGHGPKNLEYKGNWTKYGVPAYEALDMIGGWDAWKEKDLGEYTPDPGLFAVVQLEGTKPVRVLKFFRN